MLPEKTPEAFVSVRVRAPSATDPLPAMPVSDAPFVVAEMSSAPLLVTPLDAATLPPPLSLSVAPLSTTVAPV
ncbi:hypothetical protein PCE31106_03894 [Pandoraea cepalis]|uniref:Uncharacterized protein n=1 Tax=Pandoraea cepalis TaxID=2508294 RepID=A0A5E4XJ04_9BURK|nr:hypothetical protein PCE31106_03894 [Pandoraea cepalis]